MSPKPKKRSALRWGGGSPLRAGVLALTVIALASWFGFTRDNPFARPFVLRAVFADAANLQPRSPVRIAGVDVGKVTKIEPLDSERGGAIVTMELSRRALPIHQDARIKIRSRIFLEGNFFVDLQPGSPSAPELASGDTVPMSQTAAPVQFVRVLELFQRDVRADLKTLLRELSVGLERGAAGFREGARFWESAYRFSALANDATLGLEPRRDLPRVLRAQQRAFAAVAADANALRGLIDNLERTASALAAERDPLARSLPALRDTLRQAMPTLRELNASLPTLRVFAREALPGVQSAPPALRVGTPFLAQLRLALRQNEIGALATAVRASAPALVRLNNLSVPLAEQGRSLSRCVNRVLVPFVRTPIPNPDEPGNNNQLVRYQLQRGFPGLAGESRLSDGNNQMFNTMAVLPPLMVRPGPSLNPTQPPPYRPDVPCETQEPPNLHAPGGPASAFNVRGSAGQAALRRQAAARRALNRGALLRAARAFRRFDQLMSEARAQIARLDARAAARSSGRGRQRAKGGAR